MSGYKNLVGCDVEFDQPEFLTAVIGGNGSGKSNLIEALLHILIGTYLKAPPEFEFRLEYETHRREVVLESNQGSASVTVDGQSMPLKQFASRLRDGPAQVFYPELTYVYYSGGCKRVQALVRRYQKSFAHLVSKPRTTQHRPLFVVSTTRRAKLVLLALFAHRRPPADRALDLLTRIGVRRLTDVSIVLRSPRTFDSLVHEPKFWNTAGAVRDILATIDTTAFNEVSKRLPRDAHDAGIGDDQFREERRYEFRDSGQGDDLQRLGDRLESSGQNLFTALEHLQARGMLAEVQFSIEGREGQARFCFDELSEGIKQLVAVIGGLTLTNQADNLVLLDEPDTHLNPSWSWEFTGMLEDAFTVDQRRRTASIVATHDPVLISGLTRNQVLVARREGNRQVFVRPLRSPRGQGVANLLCGSEYFDLPSSLDRETQKLLDERLSISVKDRLSAADKSRLKELNVRLEIIKPGVSERDPDFVAFLRQRYAPRPKESK